ncbi:MAG: DeoR family transcriptional regulator [Patescibacteria group bacterium]|nr:DeoR family transcriptional regulator [Patescibacteria group bacterium]
MNKGFFIKLTFAVIKVLDVSRGDKELKRQIQESAESILADVLVIGEESPITSQQKYKVALRVQEHIDALMHRLGQAKKQGVISRGSFTVLEREYMRIQAWIAGVLLVLPKEQKKEKEIKPQSQVLVVKNQSPVSLVKKPEQHSKVSDRQKRILEILKNKDKAQVWELQKIFPQVTKRTLRRDLDDLLQQNLVVRTGEWNSVSYQIT